MAQCLRAVLFVLLAAISPGCAALSLFSQDHTHTHHHHYDTHGGEILTRLESIERRVGSMEFGQYPAPAPAPFPTPIE